MIKLTVNGQPREVEVSGDTPLLWVLAGHPGADRHQVRLRHVPVRGLHGSYRWRAEPGVHHAGRKRRRQSNHHHRRLVDGSQSSGAARLDGNRRASMRVLPVRTDHVRGGAAQTESQAFRCRYRCCHERQHLSLRHLSAHSQGDSSRRFARAAFRSDAAGRVAEMATSPRSLSGDLSRRGFIKSTAAAAGGLVIACYLPGCSKPEEAGEAGRAAEADQGKCVSADRHRRFHHHVL